MFGEFSKSLKSPHYSVVEIQGTRKSSLRMIRLVGRSIDLIWPDLIRLMAVMFHLSASPVVD